jgi:hypothetical protein
MMAILFSITDAYLVLSAISQGSPSSASNNSKLLLSAEKVTLFFKPSLFFGEDCAVLPSFLLLLP